jgi:diazepam-binding inhibitor (GABA receptor modulator, acyl-CoA-binding protein)
MDSLLTVEIFQPKGKAKRNAWEALVEQKVTPEEAQRRYVELVEKLKETYGYDADKEPEVIGGGTSD